VSFFNAELLVSVIRPNAVREPSVRVERRDYVERRTARLFRAKTLQTWFELSTSIKIAATLKDRWVATKPK